MPNLAALLKQPIEQQVKKISVSLNFEFVSTVVKLFFLVEQTNEKYSFLFEHKTKLNQQNFDTHETCLKFAKNGKKTLGRQDPDRFVAA